jgi:sugar phosphate isomerase/epimerase
LRRLGVIDWPAVDAALDAARYGGVFMLEVTGEGDVASCLAGLDAWKARG